MIDDIIIRLARLPDGVNGFTAPSPDGYMNVYINDRIAREQQEKALEHEIGHIERGDFSSGRSLKMVEGG